MQRSHEPIAWSLFGAGGMVLAFAGPAAIVVTAVIFAAGDPQNAYQLAHSWLSHPLGKLLFFAFVAPSLYHTVHRLYHGLQDLHIRRFPGLQRWLFYGGATLLSAFTALALLRL